MDDRSEVMLASDLMKLAHPAFCSWGTSAPEPWSAIVRCRGWSLGVFEAVLGICRRLVEVYGQVGTLVKGCMRRSSLQLRELLQAESTSPRVREGRWAKGCVAAVPAGRTGSGY